MTKDALELAHPSINEDGRVNTRDYYVFVKRIARRVINNYQTEDLPRLVIPLQYVIALRAYLFDIEVKIGINSADRSHQHLLFLLVAFRALLMYRLPINTTSIGVSRVASKLPLYAQELKFVIKPFCPYATLSQLHWYYAFTL